MTKVTAEHVCDALRKRYPAEAYALLFQVANGTGARKTRTADAVAFGLWPSRGLDVEGFEVKVSRADWRKEIADPSKASAFSRHCHRWWIAAAPGIVETGELPPQWGLLELKRGVLRQVVEAPRSEPEAMPHSMWIAVMRATQNIGLRAVQAERRVIEEQAAARAEQRYQGQLETLQTAVSEFHRQTGINIRQSWNTDEIAEALEMVRENRDIKSVLNHMGRLSDQLRAVADRIDAAKDPTG